MTKKIPRRSDCPISFGLDLFGDKWTLLILRDILLFERSRFREFAPWEHIATNILTDRLERLEEAGLITKTRDTQLKNQFIYSATKRGWQLLPVVVEIMFWGLQNDPETPANQHYVARIKTEKDILVREVTEVIAVGRFREYRQKIMGVSV